MDRWRLGSIWRMEFCHLAQPQELLARQERWWVSSNAIGGLGGIVDPCNPRRRGGVGGPKGCCSVLWNGGFPKSDCRLARSGFGLVNFYPKIIFDM